MIKCRGQRRPEQTQATPTKNIYYFDRDLSPERILLPFKIFFDGRWSCVPRALHALDGGPP